MLYNLTTKLCSSSLSFNPKYINCVKEITISLACFLFIIKDSTDYDIKNGTKSYSKCIISLIT